MLSLHTFATREAFNSSGSSYNEDSLILIKESCEIYHDGICYSVPKEVINKITTLEEAVQALQSGTVKQVTGELAIQVTEGQTPQVSLKIDATPGNVELTQTNNGLKANFPEKVTGVKTGDVVLTLEGTELKTELTFSYDDEEKKIELKGLNGRLIGEIDCKKFLIDGMLQDVTYEPTTHKITFTFNTDSGKSEIEIDLTSLVDLYDGNNLFLTSVTITDSGYTEPKAGDSVDKAVSALGTGIRETKKSIETAKTELEGRITEVENAAISVTPGQGIDIIGESTEKTISAKVKSDDKYLEVTSEGIQSKGIDEAIQNSINELDSTKESTGGEKVKVTVAEEDGKITSVTVEETDIASNTSLESEISARKAIEGQSGDTYSKNTSANYINKAESLNDADVKLDTALKETDTKVQALETKVGDTDVATQIKNAIDDLDVEEVGESGKFIESIKQEDGKITAVEKDLNAEAVAATKVGEGEAETVQGILEELHSDIEGVKTTIDNLNTADEAEDGKFVTQVTQTNGKIEVTRSQATLAKENGTVISELKIEDAEDNDEFKIYTRSQIDGRIQEVKEGLEDKISSEKYNSDKEATDSAIDLLKERSTIGYYNVNIISGNTAQEFSPGVDIRILSYNLQNVKTVVVTSGDIVQQELEENMTLPANSLVTWEVDKISNDIPALIGIKYEYQY